ncbi:MAG: metal-dependent hydrolase [Rhizobiales bacterium 32-66-11]|jgi:L-ascorbate metabolism protein UlaG (beta-lactamase superfamily)|nr:MAG: metal-dependent hydrolase [Rhizobiales bacterium 32-66-11]
MKLTWLGHSAFRVEMGEAVVLIDPFFSGNPTFPGSIEDAAQGVTHILVTHGHDDHLGDAAAIAAQSGAQVIANFEICQYLAAQGATNINPGNTGGSLGCGDFDVAFTPAVHSSGAMGENGHSVYLGNPNGLILKPRQGRSIFHMGDTDIFGDMALIQEFHEPDVGIVPVGDRFTMNGRTAAIAVRRYFRFEAVIPCHYGTFGLLAPDPSDFVAGLDGAGTRVIVPRTGQAFEL